MENREKLEKAYNTLRSMHIDNIKTGYITRGIANDIRDLKLTSKELKDILKSWKINGCRAEVHFYEEAILSNSIEFIECVDTEYFALKNIFAEREEKIEASR